MIVLVHHFWSISHSWPEYLNFQLEMHLEAPFFQSAMLVLRECTHSSPPSLWKDIVRKLLGCLSEGGVFIWVFCRQTVITVGSRVNVFDSRNHAQALMMFESLEIMWYSQYRCRMSLSIARIKWAMIEQTPAYVIWYIMFVQSLFHKQHIRPLQGSPVYN